MPLPHFLQARRASVEARRVCRGGDPKPWRGPSPLLSRKIISSPAIIGAGGHDQHEQYERENIHHNSLTAVIRDTAKEATSEPAPAPANRAAGPPARGWCTVVYRPRPAPAPCHTKPAAGMSRVNPVRGR
jgi:hypothetical protein